MDPSTRAVWEGDALHLIRDGNIMDERDYAIQQWRPTPIVSPWNSPYDAEDAYEALSGTSAARLRDYREAIDAAKKTRSIDKKPNVIRAYRGLCPDSAIAWIDACVRENSDGDLIYNPLFGSGGNDGRLDFARNYMRAVAAIIDPETGVATDNSARWLDGWLGISDAPIAQDQLPGGQFFGGQRIDPWGWILAIEGCIAFSGGGNFELIGARRFPRTSDLSEAGIANASPVDEVDGNEIWFPVWRDPISFPEAQELFRSDSDAILARQTGVTMAIQAGREYRAHEYLRVGRIEANGQAHLLSAQGFF